MTQYESDLQFANDVIKVIEAYEKGYLKNTDQYYIKEGSFFGEIGDYIYNSSGDQVVAFTKVRKMFLTNMVGNNLYQIGAKLSVLTCSRHKLCNLYDTFTEEHHFQQSMLYSTSFCTSLFVISYVNWWYETFTDAKFSLELRINHLPELIAYVKGLPQNAGL